MKYAVVLLAALAFVQADPINRSAGWSSTTAAPGWSTTTQPPTTSGWSTAPPTTGWPSTTSGWSTQPPTTQPGWAGKDPSGWSSTTTGWPSTDAPTTAGWSTQPPTTQPGWAGKDPSGWSSTTTGWPSTDAPTTAGWSTSPPATGWPSTTAGWSTSPPSGWAPSSVVINLDGALAAAGSGWAGENHAENVNVLGGWSTPAELSIAAGGDSIVDQQGQISQLTNIDGELASSINLLNVAQLVDAQENMALASSGLDINVAQSGWAGAEGQGSLASNAASNILANLGHQ